MNKWLQNIREKRNEVDQYLIHMKLIKIERISKITCTVEANNNESTKINNNTKMLWPKHWITEKHLFLIYDRLFPRLVAMDFDHGNGKNIYSKWNNDIFISFRFHGIFI